MRAKNTGHFKTFFTAVFLEKISIKKTHKRFNTIFTISARKTYCCVHMKRMKYDFVAVCAFSFGSNELQRMFNAALYI